MSGYRQIGAKGTRAEKSHREDELADDQGDRPDKQTLSVQQVKEQDLAEEIEPDGENASEAQSQILEPPPYGAL